MTSCPEDSPSIVFIVQGRPGAGKTTLALQFLMDGARHGESVLYVTLSETEEELRSVAESHGWSLDGGHIHELTPSESDLDPDEQNTMFHPSEIELAAVMLDDMTAADHEIQMQSIVHGVVMLEPLNPQYGAERRRLRVVKYRGVQYRSGYHDYVIMRGGIEVATILIGAHQGLIGEHLRTPINASYLADAVVLLRYYEAFGEVRQAISVMKKRGSAHERTIREFRMDHGTIEVGETLRQFRGILTGMPIYDTSGPSPELGG